MYTTDPQPVLRRLASPTATMLLTEDPLEEQTGTE
jgi:hypothetical protein